MRPLKFALGILVLLWAVSLSASGPVGIYGIIDKVVFEPNEQNAERLQVWGVFAYVDGGASTGGTNGTSTAKTRVSGTSRFGRHTRASRLNSKSPPHATSGPT